MNSENIWQINQKNIETNKGLIYAVLNVSPESFYDGEDALNDDVLLNKAEKLVTEGAEILELGAQSTKPGFEELTVEKEIDRLEFLLKGIRHKYPNLPIALDTYKFDVMEYFVSKELVDVINDVNGFTDDQKKLTLMNESNVGLISMFNSRKSKPEDRFNQMFHFFDENLASLKEAGINLRRLVLDPGIGYSGQTDGKQDLLFMKQIGLLKTEFNRPILTAVADKGWAKFLLNLSKNNRRTASVVAETYMFLNGARIIRTHDVKATKEMIDTLNGIENS